MNENLRLGLTLMVVTLIASLALALTNNLTAPQIEIQKQLATKESLNKVMEADSFEEINGYYDAFDSEGNLVGKVVKVEASGYSSVIEALVGVDLDEKITGVDIISQGETPGLGANVEKDSFLSQFIGKTYGELKLKKDGGDIDAITGATITSRALSNGIDVSMQACLLNETDAVTTASPEWEKDSEEYEEAEDVAKIINDTLDKDEVEEDNETAE